MRLRHVVMMSALVAAAGLVQLATPARGAETSAARQSAVVLFQDPVVVNGTFVMGLVKIVHDEDRMARGEPCTQVFRIAEGKAPEEVVAVHCKRISKPVADQTTLAMRTTDLNYRVLTAYQFQGTDHAHQLLTTR
jgi:hypothetical protein